MTVQEALKYLNPHQVNAIMGLAHDKVPLSIYKDVGMNRRAAAVFYEDCVKRLDAEEAKTGYRPEFEPMELE